MEIKRSNELDVDELLSMPKQKIHRPAYPQKKKLFFFSYFSLQLYIKAALDAAVDLPELVWFGQIVTNLKMSEALNIFQRWKRAICPP